MASRTYGIVLVTLSAILWSTAGPFVRMAKASCRGSARMYVIASLKRAKSDAFGIR